MESSKPQIDLKNETLEPEEQASAALSSSKKLHPEDIQIGDHVAISETVYQYLSFSWCGVDTTRLPPEEVVRVPCLSNDASPLVVKSICLPYVFCETIDEKHTVVDLRLNQLARLDPVFGKLVRKELKADNELDESKWKDKKKGKKRNRKKRKK